MANIFKLRDEIVSDPLGWGYDAPGSENPGPGALSDKAVADLLNDTTKRTENRTSMSGSEVYNAIDQTEWTALTAAQQAEIWDILHLNSLNPFGREASRFVSIFGGGSVTISSLQNLRVRSLSRAEEEGIGLVTEGEVQFVRSL